MVEFLQANWLWVLLGVIAVWFLFGRGHRGMGCGMGGSSHSSTSDHDSHSGHDSGGEEKSKGTASRQRRGGCC